MKDTEKYYDRELSWLSFNKRVLMEAADESVPLYERIKFLAIYSSNLDEFFRVRVASIRSIVDIDKKKINKKFNKKYNNSPKEILEKILEVVHNQQEEFGRIKREVIIPELKKEKIVFYRDEPIIEAHKAPAAHYFKSKILSYLQPVILTRLNSQTPYLDNRAIYFAIVLESEDGEIEYAHLNIPTNDLPRFVELPKHDGYYYYIAIDDIIRENLGFLFPNYKVLGAYTVKLNRDADLNIDDEYSGNLVKKIRKQIEKRNLGVPSRFLYDSDMPDELLQFLKDKFDLKDDDVVPGGKYHNMHDLFQLPNPLKSKLENEPLTTIRKQQLDNSKSIFSAVDDGDVMLHFPYQSYDYVLRLFNEAALDPDVTEIKATFYRIAANSFISNALISAANNGKKVTVFVEIKARFDEQNNLSWAAKMEEAGITIIYSIPGLKVHAKVALITKKNKEGDSVRYGYFGTGNFNEKTAEIYADEALFSKNELLTQELDKVFSYLKSQEEIPEFNHLLVSQFNIADRFKALIDQEIQNVKEGKKGHIILKLNNLQDDIMIDKLYEASQAGVKVELIVRAICCIRAGIPGLSENITVRRIVDRYLEHSRCFYFYNNGEDILFQGSADWMKRNLYRRIEVVFPILDPNLKAEIMQLLDIQLKDNVKACYLDKDLNNIRIQDDKPKVHAQIDFHKWLEARQTGV
ncbi:polyphosphate kinase 1 [Fulvivirga sediminis]|uniref:Polyphosphate kinase n=1 Tax=Fulvivirga sediminis TaxID=2803949 RepID=A0A937F4L7_9BACT|nr:polyphosphate kinase 1 [Fulvivirga sediminis]MBL3654916.1 polyphosphate kinase 1 [Fulvivirga sediminis]